MFDFFKKKTDENSETKTQEEKKSIWGWSFDNLKQAVSNTASNLVDSVVSSVSSQEEYDEFIYEEMEELLIKADLGVNLSSQIVEKLRKQTNAKPSEVKEFLKKEFSSILASCSAEGLEYKEGQTNIYFITGVNGSGKTTLIAKLAYQFKQEGKKVLVAAGDTFRAAAEEQLDIWSKRSGADIVRKDGIDAAAVVYDAVNKAKQENYDVLLVDTAGRLQNKFNLMQELSKVKAVIDKLAPECLRESVLVLDANTGQNGLSQAKVFSEAVNLTSVALTKLDGSAKGGIIISIVNEFHIPVKLVGVGEKIEDLKIFNPSDFINALFEK